MFDRVISWPNLYLAWRRASKGKRSHPNVAAFEHRLEENLCALHDELAAHLYRPGNYVNFHIHEPKRRLISAAPFRDRVVHHALCNIIEPIFEKSFIFDSYANRVGKGTHRALNRCQAFARRYAFFLQCDLRQYFPGIDHAILRNVLHKKLHDPNVIWLIDLILASGAGVQTREYDKTYFEGDDLFAALRPRGLPIGNLTSQFWANCYLNSFDHFVKRELRCPAYLRFVDDLLFFGNDKRQLWEWKNKTVERLAAFRLTIHAGAQPRPVSEGVPFLGFIVFPQRQRLKPRKAWHFQRRLRKLMRAYHKQEIPHSKVTGSVQSWVNHARYGNTVGLRKRMLCRNIRSD
ncbi:MAG: reverse transcriptase domain-containing protein [bacterium]